MLRQYSSKHRNYHCLLCGASTSHRALCQDCDHDLPRLEHRCACCSLPLKANHDTLCGKCTVKSPHFTSSIIPFSYAAPIKQLITRFKHQQQLGYGSLLSELLFTEISSALSPQTTPDLIIPVPLHRTRLMQRGFNQSSELARHISKYSGISISNSTALRTTATPFQQGLKADERKRNLQGAFSISGNISKLHIAIVDDVVTTQATCNELARQLRQHGAARVDVWAVARTLL
jgi:ComF family protein